MVGDPARAFLQAAVVPLGAAHVSGTLEAAAAILAAHPGVASSSIYAAAACGDANEVVRFLTVDPANVSVPGGPYGWDALTHLCFSRYLRIDESRADAFLLAATALLDAGADPNTGFFSDDEPRPVWESAIYGAAGVAHHPGLTRLLLERGADPNDEETAYHAAEWFDMGCVQALVESGNLNAEGVTTLLHRKLDWTHFQGAKWLLAHGADPNAMSLWCRRGLHHALERDNHIKFFELLLDYGADPALPDLEGRSSVVWAAGFGRGDVLDLFEQRGFETALTGPAAFLAACARGDASRAHSLVSNDPDIVATIKSAHPSVLSYFAGSGNAAGVGILLDLGFSMASVSDLAQARGDSPLHMAVWRGRADAVRMLLERGAQLELRNRAGHTPLQVAIRALVEESEWTPHESPEILAMLLAAGADTSEVSIPTGSARADELLRGMARR